MRIPACTPLLLALALSASPLAAHDAKFPHVHLGATLPPDYKAFAAIWYQNIPYASTPGVDPNQQSLDIYTLDLPPTSAPVMIYVHGGGGDRGDKAWSQDLNLKPAHFMAREGMIFVSINYRLGKDGGMPNTLQDIASAVAWVHNNIAQFGGDPDQIFLSGHSFGAGAVAQLGTNDSFLKKAGKDLSVLKGVIVIDGGGVNGKNFRSDAYLPDFLLLSTSWNPPGGPNGLKSAKAMVDALHATGHKGELFELLGKDHYMASSDIGVNDDPSTLAIHRWLNEALGRKETRTFPPCCTGSPSLPPRGRQ